MNGTEQGNAYDLIPKGHGMPEYGFHSEDEQWAENCIVRVKLFDPLGSWTWYLYEYDPEEDLAMAFVCGFDKELGAVSIKELREIMVPVGPDEAMPRIERDLHWEAKPLGQVMEEEGVTWHLKKN